MTIKAREVLRDCESLMAEITKEPPNELWRLRWAGLVALLRAVGHVLEKSDREISPEMRQAIDRAWGNLKASKPDPKIYWDFILSERNNVLKAYEFGPRIRTTLRTGTAWVNLTTGESGSTPGDPMTYDYFMRSGAFMNQDPRQLCHEAIEFWSNYLDAIDKEIT